MPSVTGARARHLDLADMRARHRFAALVSPHVGLMETVSFLPIEVGAVDLEVAATALGNLTAAFPHITRSDGGDLRGEVVGGGSADIDPEMSWIRAVVEGAERYATMVFSEADFIVASARDLGDAALDLDRIPRCSAEEYADPACPLRPPSRDEPIRWVCGVSLLDRQPRFVPAIMTHLHLKPWPAERFWLPISTGVAAHTRLAAALNAAICESIERDALALSWLLSLPLPRIDSAESGHEPIAALLGRVAQSNVEHHAFDATTDLGIPAIFAVQETRGHPDAALFVSCASGLGAEAAFAKAIREASPARAVLKRAPESPDRIIDFHDITHGASYYGRGGHDEDFAFLFESGRGITLAAMDARTGMVPEDEAGQTRFLIERLRRHGMEAVAIDLTTEELRDAGLWVVRVVIPDLMPISFIHRARYLATPRLRNHPGRRPGAGKDADGITLNPLPFA